MTEQVSPERFEDFKDQMFRLFNDLKGAIDTLNGKIDAYNSMYQSQSQDIAVLKTKTDEIKELKIEVKNQSEEIIRLDENMKAKQRFTLLIFSSITIIFGLISTISICINLFK